MPTLMTCSHSWTAAPSIVTRTVTRRSGMTEREIEVPMWDATHGLEVGQDVTITHRWSEEHRMRYC